MAFKKAQPPQNVPDSPEKILLDLPRRKIPSVLFHQGELIRSYVAQAADEPDVALQLPTGSGKTLVGLLIGEWRRRKYRQRVVYLCPTRQLVNQVVEQANEQYGLTVHGFVGQATSYDRTARTEYRAGDRLAITTYSALFNSNPDFSDPHTVIVDDAHAAENYVAQLWTLRVVRTEPKHAALHAALCGVLKPLLTPSNYTRLIGVRENPADAAWVEKIPTPRFAAVTEELAAVLDEHAPGTEFRYPWAMLRNNLAACHLYVTSAEILLRPLIPPTWTHGPFVDAEHRIYMSATLGGGGDLERLTGRKAIKRIPVPEGWDRQGIGRRYFIFPSAAMGEAEVTSLRRSLMRRAGRSLVLAPSDTARQRIAKDVGETLGFKVFGADDIEISKKPFVNEPEAVAVVAGRYDGIDFPGDDCRLLFVDGLPRATNAQERFIMSRMGANILYNERVQTRVLQAIGRCTRSLQDYSAVVVSGEELPDYLNDRKRRSYLHPELQAEIEFGIEQSMDATAEGLLDNLDIFLQNGREWEEANEQIIQKRDTAAQAPFPAVTELRAVVAHEIEYQERLWQGDHAAAVGAAERVLGGLGSPDLRGYRALWHYLAGSAAWLGNAAGETTLAPKSRLHFERAKEAARGISWLVELARFQSDPMSQEIVDETAFEQIERLEAVLAKLGNVNDRRFSERERKILEGLNSADTFEEAHRLLGETLGFDAGKEESDASPDPWWISGGYCFVFEDHADAEETSTLNATKARQAASHPNWMRERSLLTEGMQPISVLVTPVRKATEGAVPHLRDVALWPLGEFRRWAADAVAVVRELRRTFVEPGDLTWRNEALDALKRTGVDAVTLYATLRERPAADGLQAVKRAEGTTRGDRSQGAENGSA